MINQKIVFSFFISFGFLFNRLTAQNFKEQFNDLLSVKDTLSERLLLQKWEQTNNNDPELYVAYFNYYVSLGMRSMLILGNDPKGEQVLALRKNDSSKNEPSGYIYNDVQFDTAILNKG